MPATHHTRLYGSWTPEAHSAVCQPRSRLLHRHVNLWHTHHSVSVTCDGHRRQQIAPNTYRSFKLHSQRQQRWGCKASPNDASYPDGKPIDSKASNQKLSAEGDPSAQQQTTNTQPSPPGDSLDVETAQKLLDAEIEEQRALLAQQLQRIRTGQPLAPESASSSSSSASTDSSNQSYGQQPGRGPAIPWFKQPLLTWGLIAWTWIAFIQSWWPMIQMLMSAGPSLDEKGMMLLGMSLLVPNSEPPASLQLDQMAWVAGGASLGPLTAAVLYSGLLPTLFFTHALRSAGEVLEAYGPLVLSVYVAMSAWGSAIGQVLFENVPLTITGPGMVCGLHVGMCVTLALAQRKLRQMSGAAIAAEAAASTDTDYTSGSTGGSSMGSGTMQEAVQDLSSMSVVSRLSLVTWAVGLLLSVFQPMVGIWGILGGCLGGVFAALTAVQVVKALRWVLTTTYKAFRWLVVNILRLMVAAVQFVFGLVRVIAESVADAVRDFRRL